MPRRATKIASPAMKTAANRKMCPEFFKEFIELVCAIKVHWVMTGKAVRYVTRVCDKGLRQNEEEKESDTE
jgi:hypothetical protein